MKIILVLSAFAAAALAAPTKDEPTFVYGPRRSKKSAYGARPSYGAVPSYGAGPSYGVAGSSYGVGGSSYGVGGSSYGGVGSSYDASCPHGAGIGYAASAPIPLFLAPQAAHYREEEDAQESETGEAPAARSYGGYGGGLAIGAGAGVGPGAIGVGAGPGAIGVGAGPGAIGVFPNARVGGCAIPLLLSCAPRVVSGHVVQHEYAQPAASYKEAEQKEGHENWTHAQRANDAHDDFHPHHSAALQQQQQHEEKKKQ